MRVLSLRLSPVPGSVMQARRAVDQLAGSVSDGSLEDVRLMVSELVSNSIRHAHLRPEDGIEVTFDVRGNLLHTTVRDGGTGFLPSVQATRTTTVEPAHDCGWGLYLVDRLADRWGVSASGPTTVWFDMAADRPPSAGASEHTA